MAETETAPGAQEFIPPGADTIDALRAAAGGCRGCELYRDATQTVFGRGDEHARVVFVGEQPGDIEDQKGLPFVGPAGRLLRSPPDPGPGARHRLPALAGRRVRPAAPGDRGGARRDSRQRVPVDRAGDVADAPAARLLATIHPSAVLRADNQDVAYEGLVADLKVAAEALR